jgi:hypothetical protein
MDYSYKNQQFILIPYPNTGTPQTATFSVNSQIPIDKIRISVGGEITMSANNPGILVWTDMVNDYIGSVANRYLGAGAGPTYFYSDKIEPGNGVEFFYPNKVFLNSDYNIKFTDLSGASPNYVNPNNTDDFYLLVEYYSL